MDKHLLELIHNILDQYEYKIILEDPMLSFKAYRYLKTKQFLIDNDDFFSTASSVFTKKSIVTQFVSPEYCLHRILSTYETDILKNYDQVYNLCLNCYSLKIKNDFFDAFICNNCHSPKNPYARNIFSKLLPKDFDKRGKQWKSILKDFNYRCALSDSKNIVMEHFIPLSTGHGGTIVGNIYPLDATLNASKGNKNPFEWAKEQNIDSFRFQYLIEYLANKNGLSLIEFKDYIYWVFSFQRSESDLIKDNRRSLELFLQEIETEEYIF